MTTETNREKDTTRSNVCQYCDHGDAIKVRCFKCNEKSVCTFCAHCNTDGCDYVVDRGD